MAAPMRLSLATLGTVGFLGLAAAGFFGWRVQAEALNQEIARKRSALKTLHLGGRLPPNREAVTYLTGRGTALDQQYAKAVRLIAMLPSADEAHADPQLYFQQRVHEVQRTLERLAAARGMPSPAQLGFPKDVPPADAVPRLLLQLELIEDAAELILAQDIAQLASVKVEDPQPMPANEEGADTFLMRLPVRLRLTCSLETLTNVLGVLDRAKPMADVQVLRLKSTDAGALDVELVLTRYLVTKPAFDEDGEDDA
ncbi:MAG: hypothetical protein HYY91_02410 [Candidatus Omnitrophica bacterium]|nr:hypothetical protein [Candidatus Omnitrophota bacterium]